MGTILARVQSSSDPQKFYKIVEGGDGVVYCDCWAWKKNRTCKHLSEYALTNGKMKAATSSSTKSEYETLYEELT